MFKRQIPIRDESSERKPITMARFVGHVGRTVDTFLQVRLSTLLNNTVYRALLSRSANWTLGMLTTDTNYGGSAGQVASSVAT